jgi:serine/threonine-protein kinase
MNDLLNTYLGQYQLQELVRRGGMATVYKGYQASLDRYVAVKVLSDNADPQFAARFKREAQAIAQLQHPNILPVYDYGEQDGVLYLAGQYIENGTTLGDMLGTPMDPVAALRLTARVLAALEYAHQRGIIHRDIKPGNILMPSPTWPLLADFGIAKLLNDNEGQRLTQAGAFIGTPAYVAPEQAFGTPVDARTDLYSLGVVLYEMLTGRVPFEADTPMSMLGKHAYEPPPPPRSINPDLPAVVEPVLLRALAKDPADRYQSASLMAEALERLALQIEQARARDRLAVLYQAAVQAFEEGHWDLAVERLRELTAVDPGYEDAADLLSAAQAAQVRTRTEARQHLDDVQRRRKSLQASQLAVPVPPALPPSPPSTPDSPPEEPAAAPAALLPEAATPAAARHEALTTAQPQQGAAPPAAVPVVATRTAIPRNRMALAAIGLAVLVLGGGLLFGLNRLLAGPGIPSGSGTPTPVATAMVMGTEKDTVGTLLFRDGAKTLDEVTLQVQKLPVPAAGTAYEAWLIGAGGERRRSLGVLKLDPTGYGELVYRDPNSLNLLQMFDGMEITAEPDPDPNKGPSRNVIYTGAIPPQALMHIQHLLLAYGDTPDHIALTVGLVQQATVLDATAKEILTAQQAGDGATMRRDAEALVNLIAGPGGEGGGDLDGDGTVTNPGDGFGLLLNGKNAGYIEGTLDHAKFSAEQPDATENIKEHAQHVEVAAENLSEWAVDLRDRAVRLAAATDVAAAAEDAAQVATLADRFLNGKDMNGNETVDPVKGEAGAKTAYQHATYLANIDVVPLASAGTGSPGPAGTEVAQVPATLIPPASTPVPPSATPPPPPPPPTDTAVPPPPPATDTAVPPPPATDTAVPPPPPPTDTAAPPPPSATPVPPTPVVERAVVGTVHFREGDQHQVMAGITGTMQLPTPPAGKAYRAWLVNSASGASMSLGPLTPDAQGNASFKVTAAGNTNLLALYDTFVVSSEALGTNPTTPSAEVVVSGREPPQALVPIRRLLVRAPDAPNQTALAVGLYTQVGALYHSNALMNKSYGAGDLAGLKAQAEAIVNLIEGANGPHFGDLDKNGTVANAGDGYGLLENGTQQGYLTGTRDQAAQAAAAPDATDSIKQHAQNVAVTVQNVQDWVTPIRDNALALLAAADLKAAGPLAGEIQRLADLAYNGVGLDADGQPVPKPGSGGALTCYQEAQLLAAMAVR